MDIWAIGDKGFGIWMSAEFKYKSNKDGTLTVWADDAPCSASVTTNHGVFVEATDKTGAVIMSGGDGNWLHIPVGREPVTLRYKELPKLDLSEADIDKNRKIVTRHLLSDMPYSLKIPSDLVGAIKWFEKQAVSIPAAARSTACVSFDTSHEHGETYPNIEITYEEPETDKEVVTRLQIAAERTRVANEADRAQFRKLKQKFCAP